MKSILSLFSDKGYIRLGLIALCVFKINYLVYGNYPVSDWFELIIFWFIPSFVSWLLYEIVNYKIFENKEKKSVGLFLLIIPFCVLMFYITQISCKFIHKYSRMMFI